MCTFRTGINVYMNVIQHSGRTRVVHALYWVLYIGQINVHMNVNSA